MDQTLSSLHSLAKFSSSHPEADIVMMDDHSLMMQIQPGESLMIQSSNYESKLGCGLIPMGIGAPSVRLCTQGLKWDLGIYVN